MKDQGIPIDDHGAKRTLHPGNNPSLLMPASEQADFIKNHLA
jgi:glucosylceramidase